MLLLAHHCSPYLPGEHAIGWARLCHATRVAQVHVLTSPCCMAPLQQALAAGVLPGGVTIHSDPRLTSLRRWRRLSPILAAGLHRHHRFDVVHHATPVSFHQPGRLAGIGPPLLWGPVRGASSLPPRFLSMLPPAALLQHLRLSAANLHALWTSPSTQREATAAAVLLAANSSIRRDLRTAFGAEVGLLLDQGIDEVPGSTPPSSPLPDRSRFHQRLQAHRLHSPLPLQIFCSADRLSATFLSILLRALATRPPAAPVILRIAGEGSLGPALTTLATRLGLAVLDPVSRRATPSALATVHFLGPLTPIQLRDEFRSAHLFCHTSLTDPGTPLLLQSLAAGVPILAFDHGDAHDIVYPTCGARIPVTSPRRAVQDWGAILHALLADPELMLALSDGALQRAARYLWQHNGDRINAIYCKLAGAYAAPSI